MQWRQRSKNDLWQLICHLQISPSPPYNPQLSFVKHTELEEIRFWLMQGRFIFFKKDVNPMVPTRVSSGNKCLTEYW